jgi:uncharacterized Zn finger protein
MDQRRQLRGQEIAERRGAVQHSPKGAGWFRVRSSSHPRWYEVNVTKQTCSCPDDLVKCKHLYAAELVAEAVPRPDVVVEHPPTFADIQQEVNALFESAEAALSNAQAENDNWRCYEAIGEDIESIRAEWYTLQEHMSEFQSILAADGPKWGNGVLHALQIVASRRYPRKMTEIIAQMALAGCSIDQINAFIADW